MRCTPIVAAVLVAACGAGTPGQSGDATPPSDAAIDAAPDAMPDAATDLTADITAEGLASLDPSLRLPMAAPMLELGVQFHGTATPQPFTASVTGPFAIDHLVPNVASASPGDLVHFFVRYTGTTYGHASGAFDLTVGGVAHAYAIEEDLYPLEVITTHGGGTVTVSPDPVESSPCDALGGHCWPYGTVVTATATPPPGMPVLGWSDPSCGTGATCSVTASQPHGALTAYFGAAFDIAMTGSGDVALFQANALVGRCSASCTLSVDPTLPIDVYASTVGTFGGFDGIPGPPNKSGGTETLAAGTPSVAVDFDMPPGERWIALGAGAAFDASGNLAVVQYDSSSFLVASIDRYDPTSALLWSVTGDPGTPAFDAAGELYVVRDSGGIDAIGEYETTSVVALDPTGATLSSGMREVHQSAGLTATVLPGGGVASLSHPYSTPTTLTMYADALLTPIASATTPQGAPFCFGIDGDVMHIALDLSGGYYADAPMLAFALDGTPLGDDGGDWDWCRWGKNWSAGNAFVGYSESRGWIARTRTASVANVDSPAPGDAVWAFNVAAADPAGNLYFQESQLPIAGEEHGLRREDARGLRLRKYVDNSGTAVATVERDAVYAPLDAGASDSDYFHMGLTVYDVAVAPDGRIALTVAYIAAGADFLQPYVVILPAL